MATYKIDRQNGYYCLKDNQHTYVIENEKFKVDGEEFIPLSKLKAMTNVEYPDYDLLMPIGILAYHRLNQLNNFT